MFISKLKTFLKNEDGASMVEYAVALLVVTAVGVSTMTSLGTATGESVTDACGVITDADSIDATC